MADLLVLRSRLITNAEAAILFQQRGRESLCFTGYGGTTHERVSVSELAPAKVCKPLILLATRRAVTKVCGLWAGGARLAARIACSRYRSRQSLAPWPCTARG